MRLQRFVAPLLALLWATGCTVTPMPTASYLSPPIRSLATTKGTFTLAEYNVENLFDGQTVKIKPKENELLKSEAKKQVLAQSMRELNADVLGLVEVESLPTLKTFRDQYLKDLGYTHAALIEGNDTRGIDVAVLSRFPIVGTKSHKDVTFEVPGQPGPQKFSRDLFEATIQLDNGYRFTLFTTHLKAMIGVPKADTKRQAEAAAMRRILNDFEQRHPGENYAAVGDFNDLPTSNALAPLLDTRVAGPRLFDALSEMGPSGYTYHPLEYRSRIDYILLSPGMQREYVRASARVNRSEAAHAASDHLPSAITLSAKDK